MKSFPPKKELRSLKMMVDLVAKAIRPLIRNISLNPTMGDHKEFWGLWDNFL